MNPPAILSDPAALDGHNPTAARHPPACAPGKNPRATRPSAKTAHPASAHNTSKNHTTTTSTPATSTNRHDNPGALSAEETPRLTYQISPRGWSSHPPA